MRYLANFIDGRDLAFKSLFVDAVSENAAWEKIKKIYYPDGDYDHTRIGINAVKAVNANTNSRMVLCRDCVWYRSSGACAKLSTEYSSFRPRDDWFCADGERREQ